MQRISHRMMRLMARVMPSCQEISEMVSASMDRELPLRKRIAIRMHVYMCALCRRYEKQLHLLRKGFRLYADPQGNTTERSLSPAAKERLQKALDQAAK